LCYDFNGKANKKHYQELVKNLNQLEQNRDEISLLVLADQAREFGKFENVSIEDLKEMLDVNIYQKGFLSRLLINKFYKRGSDGKKCAIVFLSSI